MGYYIWSIMAEVQFEAIVTIRYEKPCNELMITVWMYKMSVLLSFIFFNFNTSNPVEQTQLYLEDKICVIYQDINLAVV